MTLQLFFGAGIILFFVFVWLAWTESFGRIKDQDLRRIEREDAGHEDAGEDWRTRRIL